MRMVDDDFVIIIVINQVRYRYSHHKAAHTGAAFVFAGYGIEPASASLRTMGVPEKRRFSGQNSSPFIHTISSIHNGLELWILDFLFQHVFTACGGE